MFSTLFAVSLLLHSFGYSSAAPKKNPVKLQSMPEYVKLLDEFKKLQSVKTKDEMKSITTLGLVSGALQVQKSMRENLGQMVAKLLDSIDMKNARKSMPKIEKVERTLQRDEKAILILANAMDYARGDMTIDEFRGKIKRMMRDYHVAKLKPAEKRNNETVRERLEKLKTALTSHVKMMKKMIKEKSQSTIEYLEEKHDIVQVKGTEATTVQTIPKFSPMPIFAEPIENNLIDGVRRQDDDVVETQEPASLPQPETDSRAPPIEIEIGSSEELPPPPPGGPIVGLLAGLSGGEDGSDVGALVGALTGVVMNLFGPGGLDIPALLSGGTALLAGLLSGDRNFGTVLGEYVGLAVDGFSGGGGAVNNGRFFGNFLGTLVAELSADPEDDDLPPKPSIFIDNFLNSFSRAKGKLSDDMPDNPAPGSGSFGFITHIVRAIVGGVTSFVLNASFGSSASLLSASSNPSPPKSHWG